MCHTRSERWALGYSPGVAAFVEQSASSELVLFQTTLYRYASRCIGGIKPCYETKAVHLQDSYVSSTGICIFTRTLAESAASLRQNPPYDTTPSIRPCGPW